MTKEEGWLNLCVIVKTCSDICFTIGQRMCSSMANPTVASATAAASGVLTPMPCIPALTAPWAPGGKELITNMPALLENCKLVCMYGGNISINFPGHACNSEGK